MRPGGEYSIDQSAVTFKAPRRKLSADELAASKNSMVTRMTFTAISGEARTALARGDTHTVSDLRGEYNQLIADLTARRR